MAQNSMDDKLEFDKYCLELSSLVGKLFFRLILYYKRVCEKKMAEFQREKNISFSL